MKTAKELSRMCVHKYGYGINPEFVLMVQQDALGLSDEEFKSLLDNQQKPDTLHVYDKTKGQV